MKPKTKEPHLSPAQGQAMRRFRAGSVLLSPILWEGAAWEGPTGEPLDGGLPALVTVEALEGRGLISRALVARPGRRELMAFRLSDGECARLGFRQCRACRRPLRGPERSLVCGACARWGDELGPRGCGCELDADHLCDEGARLLAIAVALYDEGSHGAGWTAYHAARAEWEAHYGRG